MTEGADRRPEANGAESAAGVAEGSRGRLGGQLLAAVAARGDRPCRLSVVGLCKNAGKTVTLNHLIRAAARHRVPLGLVSTGRDGEAEDAVTELPKPRIWAPAGTWIATAARALEAGTATVDIFRELPLATPFGPVVLGRVAREGEVLLIGPGSARRIGEILGALESYGAQLSLVDGSFDRIAAAAPTVTGRLVLAAGAAYSQSMAETVAQVRHVLDLFDLPAVPPAMEADVERAAALAPVAVVSSTRAVAAVPVESPLGDPEVIVGHALAQGEAAGQGHPGAALVLEGALGDRLLLTLLKLQAFGIALVVGDPTRILVDRRLWRRWRRLGGQAYVRRRAELVAVTTNAYSPVGPGYDAAAFFEAIRSMAQRPVFDLETGLPRAEGHEGGDAGGAAAAAE